MEEETVKIIINDIFKKNNDHTQVLKDIYKLFIPYFDKVKEVVVSPHCGKEIWKYLSKKFIEFDEINHPNLYKGFIWIDQGFSLNKNLDDWEVFIDKNQFIMKE